MTKVVTIRNDMRLETTIQITKSFKVVLTKNADGYSVEFPDIKGLGDKGIDYSDAMENAAEKLHDFIGCLIKMHNEEEHHFHNHRKFELAESIIPTLKSYNDWDKT